MKNNLLLILILFLGCENNEKQKIAKKNELIKRNKIENSQTYNINLDSSIIYWTGKKIYKSHNGTLKFYSGNVQIKDNSIVGGEFQVDMNSIVCIDIKKEKPNQGLVNHLKNEDFFDVYKHPYSYLKIINSEKKTDEDYLFLAELTIKDIIHPITFSGSLNKQNNKFYFKTSLSFDRTLWDIKYGSGKFFEELGDKAILDEIDLKIELITKAN